MLSRILVSVFIGIVFSASVSAQTNSKSLIHYRILMTSINIEDVQPDEISISLNAFNTGRKPVDMSEFNSIPQEIEIKFEESFYRSSLSNLENEIRLGLINKNIVIPNGKILRNIRLSLPSNETLYKQLTKKQNRYTKAYTPKKRNNKAAELKYKTSDKKLNSPPTFASKNKKKKSRKGVKVQEEKIAATINANKPSTKVPSKPRVNTPNSTANSASQAKLEKEVKEKEMAAQKINDKEELEIKNNEMEAAKMKEKEMVALKLKGKELEAQKMKEKEMAAIEMKEKERKELEMKNKEMEAQKMKEKEMTNKDIAIETSEPQKNEKLSILERQKLKRKEREEAKQNEYKIEKASQKEDEKAILESLGVGKSKDKNEDDGVAFDTRASVESSKNSYAEKQVCPDLVLNQINVVKKSKNWVTLEYTLTNNGKGPAYLGKDTNGQGIALRAFLSSSEKISRGALPLGGGFVDSGKKKQLFPNNSQTGTLKLDIRKMTRFTPYVIINLDPFNVIQECDKTNNYGNVKVGG